MGMMEEMMEKMVCGMSQEDRRKMMEKFFAGTTVEDKQGLMGKAMPRMMEMMPKCVEMVVPQMPKEDRVEFVVGIIPLLMEKARTGMSEDEQRDLKARVAEKL